MEKRRPSFPLKKAIKPKPIKTPVVKKEAFFQDESKKEWKTDNPYKLGVAYLKNKNFESAADLLKENLKEDADCKSSRFGLGVAYLNMEKYSEAVREFKKFLINEPSNLEARLHLANAYFKADKIELSIKEFSTILKYNNNEINKKKLSHAYFVLANKYFKNRLYENASENYLNALAYDSNNAVILQRAGETYKELKDYTQAILFLENALKNLKDSHHKLDIYLLLIDLKIKNKDEDQALSLCNEVLEIYPGNTSATFLAGEIFFHKKDYYNAMEKYNEALKSDPQLIQALINIGQIYVFYNYLNKALTVYHKVLELNKGNPVALCNISIINYKLGDKNAAYDQLIKLSQNKEENNYLVFKYLGILLLEKGMVEGAILRFSRSIELNPEDVDNYINLGVCYHKLNDHAKAVLQYTKAIELDPGNQTALKNLALLNYDSNNNQEAIELYKTLLELEPENKTIIKNIGNLYRKIGAFDEAIAHYVYYIEIDSKDPEVYYNLGLTLFETNQMIKATNTFKNMIKVDKKYGPAGYYYLSKIYEKNRQYGIALDYARSAVYMNTKFTDGFIQYAIISMKMGNKEKALTYLQKANSLDPDNKTVRTLLAQFERQE